MPKANGVPHFMQLATADLLGSTIRTRAIRLGRPDLWFLYLELILNLQEAGGTLPSNPDDLLDTVTFFTREQIAELLPLLKPSAGSRGGIVVEGDTCHQPRVTAGLQEAVGFSHLASQLGKARAASARRGPDGRMMPSEGGVRRPRNAAFKDRKNQRSSSARPALAPAAGVAGPPLDHRSSSAGPPAGPPLDQQHQRESSLPLPLQKLDLCEKAAAGGKGGAGGNGETDNPPPPQSASPERPPLLDHNPEVPYERDLAEMCRQVVEARGRGDDYAVLREITATSRGKRMDGIWGASEGWCRRSYQAGQAILAQLRVPQMGQVATVSDSPQLSPDERRASVAAGMALIAAAAAGRAPDIVLAGGKALVAEPSVEPEPPGEPPLDSRALGDEAIRRGEP